MWLYLYMFFLHFLADFVLQSREMGQKKSTEIPFLIGHVAIQWGVMLMGLLQVMDPIAAYQIACLNAGIHGLIDWYIWKLYKYRVHMRLKEMFPDEETFQFQADHFEYWKDKGFYSTIGFDQFLHHATIVFVTWIIL